MSATSTGDMVSDVIIHAAPALCIHVPTFEIRDASHRARKARMPSADHGELTGGVATTAGVGSVTKHPRRIGHTDTKPSMRRLGKRAGAIASTSALPDQAGI